MAALKVEQSTTAVADLLKEFVAECRPLESEVQLALLSDARTSAVYCECHIAGSVLIKLGTTDVPLDPDEQADYRANREIEDGSVAFHKMKEDAKLRRSFSNIVVEWKKESDSLTPIKVIGGQHRFEAIRHAVENSVDVLHGVKVYFALDMAQRLDVTLISNTNIDISGDLLDRLRETAKGPGLRDWCQSVGLLQPSQDFADSYARGGPISVRMATTFITNYFDGKAVDPQNFSNVRTTPVVYKSGDSGEQWERTKVEHPQLWSDPALRAAGKAFYDLVAAQRESFSNPSQGRKRARPDYPEKALNLAVVAAWAFVAGLLQTNPIRLERHFALKNAKGHDPLNASELAAGRHYTDSQNYRGLGYRTDPQERGRLTELFFLQAESGKGITKSSVEIAIKKYHAKQGQLEVEEAEAKAKERDE
jgi:hypothetical protein